MELETEVAVLKDWRHSITKTVWKGATVLGSIDEGVDVKITPDGFVGMVKSTWHVAILLGGLIWAVAAYKTGVDSHLNYIDNQLKVQDNKLNWLINHHGDKDSMPMTDQTPYVPQSEKVKPQSSLQRFSYLHTEATPETAGGDGYVHY